MCVISDIGSMNFIYIYLNTNIVSSSVRLCVTTLHQADKVKRDPKMSIEKVKAGGSSSVDPLSLSG